MSKLFSNPLITKFIAVIKKIVLKFSMQFGGLCQVLFLLCDAFWWLCIELIWSSLHIPAHLALTTVLHSVGWLLFSFPVLSPGSLFSSGKLPLITDSISFCLQKLVKTQSPVNLCAKTPYFSQTISVSPPEHLIKNLRVREWQGTVTPWKMMDQEPSAIKGQGGRNLVSQGHLRYPSQVRRWAPGMGACFSQESDLQTSLWWWSRSVIKVWSRSTGQGQHHVRGQ